MQLQAIASGFARQFLPKTKDHRLEADLLPRYSYTPLKVNQIRLITILSGRGDNDVHVEIEVITVGTEDATGYAALSYVWGDATKNLRPVLVNGNKVLWVTYNLWQALKRIRASHEDRVVWADAICINQGDQNERSSQIQHMRWIYPQANTVLCWLGDDDGTVEESFSELNLWADAYENNEQRSSRALQVRAYLARREAKEMNPLGLLFSRPYFTRAWCLPEICVPPKKVLVLCGTNEMSWRRLYYGFLAMATSLFEPELGEMIGPSLSRVIPMLNISWNPPEKMLLSSLIPLMASRECSDQRDKIFSLLGLVSRRSSEYPAPDYTRSIEDVCIIYTRASIQMERRLDILRAICPFREDDSMPSWSLKPDQWLKDRFTGELDTLNGMPSETYRACANMNLRVETARGLNDPELRIHGFCVDSIVAVHDVSDFLKDLFSSTQWRDVLEKADDFCGELGLPKEYVATRQPITAAFLNTLCCNEFWMQSEEKKASFRRELIYKAYKDHVCGVSATDEATLGAASDVFDEKEFFQYMARLVKFERSAVDTIHIKEGRDASVPHSFLEKQAILELSKVVMEKVENRKLLITDTGYIGFGLQRCSVLDKVCLLPGSDVPLVLRELPMSGEDTTRHAFIGDAYIHGIMYGEVMEGSAVSIPKDEYTAGMGLFCIV